MTLNRIKWTLFIVPAIVIGLFETIRHTLLEHILPMELGNWITAVIDAMVIALVSKTLLHQFSKAEKELSQERQAHAILRERERLARILHDQIAQSIFYSGVQIKTARKMANKCGSPELNSVLEDVVMSLREIDENLRQSIFNLKSESNFALNLKDRVEAYLAKMLSRTELTWKVDFPQEFSWVTHSQQVQLFGVLQEAVTNIVKHAHASHVYVRLHTSTSRPLGWSFKVEDDGVGFDGESQRNGHGLDIMAGRARDIGAELRIESGPSGTTICVHRGLD
ncbi:sensor histidine kinase [Alicyclobacillus ferrooxydans]|uniref:histidine kinase n=1 Tax=Alicyclobacillus ferrooxydans TaxID=471514 RepID=A0A0P9EKR8_9BACL|nr:sensor histidine kinase [Alicyclobacillus ferrooxydans]KPV43762.1 hypothetical protein AN477_10235 [Alicyclobacillus ferrooxydans]